MKRCPKCRRDYRDETLLYCLDDGSALLDGPSTRDVPTEVLADRPADSEKPTRIFEPEQVEKKASLSRRTILIAILLAIAAAAGVAGYLYFRGPNRPIDSIAVMPFLNESESPDIEYLSDGMTETLIGSLSQIPNLSIKARSSVFRYKGKETNAQTIGRELAVQAILTGRVVQRGQDLTLYVELVEAQSENSLWKQTYNKTMTNLVSLQNEIARDVAESLKLKLSGPVQQKLTKNSTIDPEAYQLYLKGRFHTLKNTRQDLLKAVPYLEQATDIDPNYALAYVGLADAYRGLALSGHMRPIEYFPKAKAAAIKAVEIDASSAEAHSMLGWIVFWYDWDWAEAERHCKKALELDPNNGEAHLFYAHVLSVSGRPDEAIAEARRAREAEPLNLRTSAIEAQFLIHAGKPAEALILLEKAIELDPNYWFAYQFAASAYIEMGMYDEAAAAARKGIELYSINSRSAAFLCYALAKAGKRSEALAALEELLKPSAGYFASPYNIALAYNGLGESDQSLKWLERGIEQRDPRMTSIVTERKWKNLRDDPQFKALIRKMGFPE